MTPADIAPAADAVVQTTQGGSIRAGVWTGVFVAALGVITVIVKQWGPWLTITGNQRRADIEGMGKRIAELEARLDRQASESTAKLEQERAQHAAEIQHMRHRMNNLDTSLTLLLALIEQDPTKASEAAARVRQKRERQEANEIAEKSVLTAARLAPTAIPEE
ncbi:hypothetical protein [Novosphingobium sp. fls2-241-R2A-195]|uniref:hypothetical protein n=1 Tax=Novosphingobium sp. fls2-241-R2A-195 TaxID=3040296 RepID=UPI00254C7E00|nr:hypothetical protein [Novosphingobium sp. fls2-241-R2A-195]